MGLNIKNEQAHAMAAQIADLTGESLTQVVISALEMRLQTLQRVSNRRKADRILEFATRFSHGIDSKMKSSDHGRILYGKDGLPR